MYLPARHPATDNTDTVMNLIETWAWNHYFRLAVLKPSPSQMARHH